jgi:hypothetical protein
MKSEFRSRLNGDIMPEIFIQPVLVSGEPTGEYRSPSRSMGLAGSPSMTTRTCGIPALPQFVLEYRDETSWALLPQAERRASPDKGWNRVTPQELVEILESAGAIKRM